MQRGQLVSGVTTYYAPLVPRGTPEISRVITAAHAYSHPNHALVFLLPLSSTRHPPRPAPNCYAGTLRHMPYMLTQCLDVAGIARFLRRRAMGLPPVGRPVWFGGGLKGNEGG